MSEFFANRQRFEEVELTPEICQGFIADKIVNPHNRKIKKNAVDFLKNHINAGTFECGISDIKFGTDDEGKPMLLDGHHRIMAGALADKSFKVQAQFNCPRHFLKHIDTGNARSVADVYTMTKPERESAHEVVAIFNAYDKMHGRKGYKPPVTEVMAFDEKNGEALDLVMDALNGYDADSKYFFNADGTPSANKSTGLKSVSIKAPLVYCYSLFPEETKEFIRQMVTQGAAAIHTGPERLQYAMTAGGGRKGLKRDTPFEVMFKTLSAFQLFLDGKTQKQLKSGKDIVKILRYLQRKAEGRRTSDIQMAA